LQERQIERVGGTGSIPVDVRVVAATNRPLEQMVAAETFRSDLYYRLDTFPVLLPPLRKRPEDLRPLTLHLLARHAQRMHRQPPEVPAAVWRALESHHWPGNVRELENYLERALILSPGDTLTLQDLPGARGKLDPVALAAPVESAGDSGVEPFDEEVRKLLRRALAATGDKIYGEGGAAELLELKPTTLQGKLRKYGLR
jgi:formate hydrogenlyase transcriptional activator